MPKGKARPIALTKIQRRALINLMPDLEERSDENTRFWGKYIVERGITSKHDERYYMPILKLKAIILAADGKNNVEISHALEISQPTIGRWRNEFNYILSRDDLPFERITHYFLFDYNPVGHILAGHVPYYPNRSA